MAEAGEYDAQTSAGWIKNVNGGGESGRGEHESKGIKTIFITQARHE